MSVTYFSIFSPDFFQLEIKNEFISKRKKLFEKKFKRNLSPKNQLPTENEKNTHYKTTSNIYTNNHKENMRDLITAKKRFNPKKLLKKPKYNLSQALKEKIQPYKQYILEKRQYENIKNERNKYKFRLKSKKELLALPDKSKIRGVNFAKQKGFGFFDQYVESKNYSKEKINHNKKPVFMVKRNKFDELDFVVLEDIKNKKKTSVFEEDFDIKNYLRYDKFRQNTMAFLKFLDENPNYNY